MVFVWILKRINEENSKEEMRIIGAAEGCMHGADRKDLHRSRRRGEDYERRREEPGKKNSR